MDFDIYKLYYSPIENNTSNIYYGNETHNIVIGTPIMNLKDFRLNNKNQHYIICDFFSTESCQQFTNFIESIESKIFKDICNHDDSLAIKSYIPFYNNNQMKLFINPQTTNFFENNEKITLWKHNVILDKVFRATIVLDTLNIHDDLFFLKWDILKIYF